MISTCGEITANKKPYRFIMAWTRDSSNILVIAKAWSKFVKGGMEARRFARRLEILQKPLRSGIAIILGFAQK